MMDQAINALLTWKGLAVFGWLALVFVLERAVPAAREPAAETGNPAGAGWRRITRNLGLWLANVGLSPLVVVPLSIYATQFHLGWRPDWWAGWPGLLLDLLLLDFLIYWWHRANHEVGFLWRFHEVHHLDRFLDSTSALRFHFGEVLLSAGARAVVIALFDIPIASILVFEALILAAAIFHHSNIALPAPLERVLARVVITPSIHWVHHHKLRRDTDSNYGTILSIWDPLFGSRSPTPRALTMPIGVEARAEQPFLNLLVRPFVAESRRTAQPERR